MVKPDQTSFNRLKSPATGRELKQAVVGVQCNVQVVIFPTCLRILDGYKLDGQINSNGLMMHSSCECHI